MGHVNSVSVQTLLGCFGLGLTLMNTSSCSIREVMQCGSTSMSSLISNISTSGRQPCGKHKEESKKKRNEQSFLHRCKSFIQSNCKCFKDSVGLGPKAAKLQLFSSDPSTTSHVEKKNSSRYSRRKAFIYWALTLFFLSRHS